MAIKSPPSIEVQRRHALALLGASGLAVRLPALARGPGPTSPPTTATAQRDHALLALRQTDATPSWFTSANWDNRAYQPWTDYLSGKLSEAEFSAVCAKPSDYCLRDVWNLRRATPAQIDWSSRTPFNWNGVHALALRFYRTGEDLYLRKWLAVVADHAAWSLAASAADEPLQRGMPQALLSAAMAWGGIFTALGIVAKGLGAGGRAGSPYPALAEPLAPDQLDRVPAEALPAMAASFARGAAVALARAFVQAKYVPNQRAFGFEALGALDAYFPDAAGVKALRPALQLGVTDLVTRYRLPDGGQLEQSFNYAENLVTAAARLAKLPFETAPPWHAQAQATVSGWSRLAGALATPGGGLPQVGNAVWGRFGRALPLPQYLQTSLALPFSGHYVMRSGWDAGAAYLHFWVRRAARGHSMAGCNAVQVAAYGRHLLAAGGAADYLGRRATPQTTAYLAEDSSWKTCTVVVDRRSQRSGSLQGLPRDAKGQPDITLAPQVALQSRWHSSATFDLAEGLYGEGYGPTLDDARATPVTDVSHLRRVVFVRPLMLWLVLDLLRTEASHHYTQIWKFAPPRGAAGTAPGFDKGQIELLGGEHLLRSTDPRPGAVNLALHHLGAAAPRYRAYFGEGAYGWHSLGPLAGPQAALDVHADWQGRGPQLLLTAILPYRGQHSPLAATRDRSTAAAVDCTLELRDGARLHCAAAAAPAHLNAGRAQADRTELLLVLQRPGQPDVGLQLGGDEDHEFGPRGKTPIRIPEGLRWQQDSAGRLQALYTHA